MSRLLSLRIRTITTGEVTYQTAYPTVGFASAMMDLGGPLGAACATTSAHACLIDAVLSNNGNPTGSGKSGYSFTTAAGTSWVASIVGYGVQAIPLSINQTGIRGFCAEEDAVVRVDPAGVCSTDEAGILTFNPLNQ